MYFHHFKNYSWSLIETEQSYFTHYFKFLKISHKMNTFIATRIKKGLI